MAIAYLINRYPEASHSFIRREIAALERLGVGVRRFTVRRWQNELADEADRLEKARTRSILEASKIELLWAILSTVFGRPRKFLSALRLAFRVGKKSDRGLLYHAFYLGEACLLRRWLEQENIEHVHAHFGTNSTCVAMLCRELGGPKYSFTVHGPDEFDRPALLALADKIERAEFVVGISTFGKSQLMRWSDFAHWNKIHIVHCGVDQSFLDVAPTSVPVARRAVCVGRLAGAKGQSLLVEAAARLKNEGLRFEIVLAGSGPMHKELEALVERLDVGDCVRILGWVSNTRVRDEVLNSRVMVLPSFAEGLPVAIMEALALSRPVISTRIAGTPELVENGTTGWLIEPGSVDQLVDALREAFNADTDWLTQMGSNGRARVHARHDVRGEANKLWSLIASSRTELANRDSNAQSAVASERKASV